MESPLRRLAPVFVAGAVCLASLVGCFNSPNPPTDQSLKVTVSYSGTAQIMPFTKHNVYIVIDGQRYYRDYFLADPSSLSSGQTHTCYYPLAPGDYQAYIYWDWNDDGVEDSFEPRAQEYPINFTMDGLSTKRISATLVDQTNPTSPGEIDGIVDYSALASSYQDYPLYILVEDLNYNIIPPTPEAVNYFGGIIFLPVDNEYYYNCKSIPAGTYRVGAFLDLNLNGKYDSGTDKRSDFYLGPAGGAVVVSPGLPTVGIDLKLNN